MIGCIHTMWVIEGLQFELSELRVAEGPDLHLRKKMLYEEAECFITLPGGFGTYDELWEVICEKQLGLRSEPICIVNVDPWLRVRSSSSCSPWACLRRTPLNHALIFFRIMSKTSESRQQAKFL